MAVKTKQELRRSSAKLTARRKPVARRPGGKRVKRRSAKQKKMIVAYTVDGKRIELAIPMGCPPTSLPDQLGSGGYPQKTIAAAVRDAKKHPYLKQMSSSRAQMRAVPGPAGAPPFDGVAFLRSMR